MRGLKVLRKRFSPSVSRADSSLVTGSQGENAGNKVLRKRSYLSVACSDSSLVRGSQGETQETRFCGRGATFQSPAATAPSSEGARGKTESFYREKPGIQLSGLRWDLYQFWRKTLGAQPSYFLKRLVK